MKRCFLFILAFSFLVSILGFTASAENVDGKSITNLFDTGNNIYYSIDHENWFVYDGLTKFENVDRIWFKWRPESMNVPLSHLLINVYKSEQSAFQFYIKFRDSGGYYGFYNVGNIHPYYQYRADVPANEQDIEDITLRMVFPNNYTGYISLVSCLGYSDISEQISKCNVYTDKQLVTSDNGKISTNRYKSVQMVSVPYSQIHSEDVLDGYHWFRDNIYIDINKDHRKLRSYDSAEFVIDAWQPLEVIGVSLYPANSIDPVIILPDEQFVVQSYNRPNLSPEVSNVQELITYYIKVDLSGYDLSNYTIDIGFSLEPSRSGVGSSSYEFTYFVVRDICFTLPVVDLPWYTRLWNWMSGGFDRVVNAIVGDPSDGAMSAAGEAMSEQASDFQSANDELASLDQPDVDVDQLLGGISFDPVGVNILTGITYNKYASSLIVIVFTFVLLGFILFGKKR